MVNARKYLQVMKGPDDIRLSFRSFTDGRLHAEVVGVVKNLLLSGRQTLRLSSLKADSM